MVQITRQLNKEKTKAGSTDALGHGDPSRFSFKYFFIFLFAGLLTSVLSSHFLAAFSANPTGATLMHAAITFTVLAFVVLFQSLFLRNFQAFLWVSLVEVAGLFVSFYPDISSWSFFAAAVFVWQLIVGYQYGNRIINERLDFSFLSFASHVGAATSRAVALFLAVFYIGLYVNTGLSQQGFDFFLDVSAPVLEPAVGEFETSMSVDQFYKNLAQREIERKFSDNQQFLSMNDAQRAQAYGAAAQELRNEVASVTSVAADPNESVGSYFYKITLRYLPAVDEGPHGVIATILLIFALYSAIIFFGMIVRMILVVPLSWLFYQLFFVLGIVKTHKETVIKEQVYFE